ncbi:hypothetical protein Daus18300_005678 [Diaporthe australafricana]|uniref:Uncharacterized protein n=1 Tax=Diaporthe australafricana TaxID=127596 RepID=A0ABR3X0C2_9PEZI
MERWAQLPQLEDDSSPPASVADDDDLTPSDHKKRQKYGAIVLLPGKQPIRSKTEMTSEMKENLRDLMRKVKTIHYGGTDNDTVPSVFDVNFLTRGMFAKGCITGKAHQMCGKGNLKPKINDVGAQVGKASIGKTASTAPVAPKKKTSIPKAKAHKFKKMALEGATEPHSRARQAQQPVHIGCQEAMEGGVVTFKYYDADHKILPRNAEKFVTVNATLENLANAKGLSMQLHDGFKMQRCREYNLRVAIYLARNRLTHWANGNDVASRPGDKDMELFVPYQLMRNLAYHDPVVMAKCKETPIPGLWVHMTHLF